MQTQEVVVDPFLLCLPNPCDSLAQLEGFITAIVGWSGFLDSPDTCVLLSDSVRIALNNDDEFPHRHKLKELIQRFNCDLADANTVSKVTNSILEKTPALENYYGISTILVEDSSFRIEPANIVERLKPNCQKAFKDDLVIVGFKDMELAAGNLLIASRRIAVEQSHESVAIIAELHEIEHLSADSAQACTFPILISQNIPLAFEHEKLGQSLDLWALWNEAASKDAVRECVEAEIEHILASGADACPQKRYEIGDRFVESLHTWQAHARRDYAMITIESCARIVLGIPKNEVIPFRVNKQRTSVQRIRSDGALAFRTHLTQSGVGLRLMYWQLLDGKIEFANIGGKKEEDIL